MQKLLMSLTLTVLLLSCSSMRLRYDGEFSTSDGKQGHYIYEKTYSVSNMQTWCIITGIIYGGACWGYLTFPTTNMRKEFYKDAESNLVEVTKSQGVNFDYQKTQRISWNDGDITSQVTLNSQVITGPAKLTDDKAKPVSAPIPAATPAPSSSGEFIR